MVVLNNTTETDIFGDNLFFVPVTTAADDVKIKITYNLTAIQGSTEGYTSTTTHDFSLPANSFDRNKAYTYTFIIGGLNDIKMNTEIDVYIPVENDGKTMVIATAADLVRFRDRVNGIGDYTGNAQPGLNAMQVADIDMGQAGSPDAANWTPIKNYAGTYNENGRKIKNLKLTASNDANVGLFANTTKASLLTGIRLEGGTLNINNSQRCKAGLLVGTTEGTVSYCSAVTTKSDFEKEKRTDASYSGGLIGINSGIVTYSNATCTGTTVCIYNGGFAGLNKGTIVACFAQNNRTSRAAGWYLTIAGGFVGSNEGNIYGCYAKGSILAGNYAYITGFAGQTNTSVTASCYSSISLNNYGTSNILSMGGFIGKYLNGTVTNCYSISTMSVSGSWAHEAGGFISHYRNQSLPAPPISNCFCHATKLGSSINLRYFHNNRGADYNGKVTKVTNCYTNGTPVSPNGDITGLTVDATLTAPPIGTRPIDWTPASPITIKTTKANPAKRYYPTKVEEITITNGADLWEEELGSDGFPRIKGLE